MIEVTLTELALWVLGGTMVLVGLFSWLAQWSNRNSEIRALKNRVGCRVCLHVFEDPVARAAAICPHCGAACERGRSRSLG